MESNYTHQPSWLSAYGSYGQFVFPSTVSATNYRKRLDYGDGFPDPNRIMYSDVVNAYANFLSVRAAALRTIGILLLRFSVL